MIPIFTSSNTFKNQLLGEKTILVTQRHWIFILAPLLIIALFALLPFAIYLLISSASWYYIIASFYWFLVSIWFLVLWNLAFYNIIIYFLNIIIVTNKRVIKIEQKGFFRYAESELELGKIQDASVKILGPLATFFGFGNMEIQSAGALVKFSFDNFPKPQKIKNTIMDLKIKR